MTDFFQRQKIQSLLSDESLKETIRETLKSEGIPYHTPCLKVEILNQQSTSFQMEKSDVLKVFSHFGEIKEVRILGSIALILFKDLTSAFFAQKIFSEREIPEMNVVLRVSWYYNEEHRLVVPVQEPSTDLAPKYTTRFDIQIENDKEFQVARRLIGPKGINMKNIVEKCCRGMTGPMHDVIKLRLRGRGSGFREGPEKIESLEPLHICISSKYSDKLSLASEEIEKLVLHVYNEYREYRSRKGLAEIRIGIKKSNNIGYVNEHIEDENLCSEDSKNSGWRNESRKNSGFGERENCLGYERGSRKGLFERPT